MQRVLFYDTVCNKAYDPVRFKTEAFGGTEATVMRIAEELAKDIHVDVAQHKRIEVDMTSGFANYIPINSDLWKGNYTHVICLRHYPALDVLRKSFPNAKLYLWLHDLTTVKQGAMLPLVEAAKADIICVSNWHKTQTRECYTAMYPDNRVYIQRIYNPIADLEADKTPVDRDKLVFFSSPHKGLEHTLGMFREVRKTIPSMQLYLANPGYYTPTIAALDNVVQLGQLPHHEVIDHVRSSLAVFHLNREFPETFGLVYAEANAVGTPFLTDKVGAVYELVDYPLQFLDTRDVKAVVDRLVKWRENRPKVSGNPLLKLSTVIRDWVNLLRKK